MSDSMALLLTESQELAILQDQDVGSMMTLFDDVEHLPEGERYNLYQQQIFQQRLINANDQHLVNANDQHLINTHDHNGLNGMTQYSAMPVVTPPLPPLAIAPSVITNEEYAGPLNFEVMIDPHHSKTPWVYSAVLNKIFIGMSNPFPIDFKWSGDIKNLFVRATPLFSLAQFAQDLVTRCMTHSMPTDTSNRNVSEEIRDHVIRCQSPSAIYSGSKEAKIHLNVVVPLGIPQTGTDSVRIMYSFVCKNSCPSGMNRKPLEVVFTLEDELGNVLGRRKLSVRVCSCPKRDKEKEEKDHLKEAGENGGPPPGKKRKGDKNDRKPPSFNDASLDSKEYSANIAVYGKHNMQLVLQYAVDRMAGEILLRNGPNEEIKKCIANLSNQLKNLD